MPGGVDSTLATTTERIKRILRRDLKLPSDAKLDDDMPLVGGEFDLDSLDILLLVTSVEKEFGIKIASESIGREAFASVESLARFVDGLATGG
jgi:acyl carrier protein